MTRGIFDIQERTNETLFGYYNNGLGILIEAYFRKLNSLIFLYLIDKLISD